MSEKLTSQNGWPASKDPNEIHIKSYKVAGTDIKVRVAEGAAPLLLEFAKEFHARVEPIDGGQLDDWGYAFRPIRGTTDTVSNHSSGTALDLNAAKHPLGKKGTFNEAQMKIIRGLCKKLGLRHGIDYKSRPDEMHVEVNISPAEAKKLIAELGLKA